MRMTAELLEFSFFLGQSVCHQIPNHSLYYGKLQLPLCARDTGLHFGFWSGALFAWRSGRAGAGWPPSRGAALWLMLFAALAVSDWLTHALGWWHGSNAVRLITGLSTGMMLGYFVAHTATTLFGNNRHRTGSLGPAIVIGAIIAAALLTLLYTLQKFAITPTSNLAGRSPAELYLYGLWLYLIPLMVWHVQHYLRRFGIRQTGTATLHAAYAGSLLGALWLTLYYAPTWAYVPVALVEGLSIILLFALLWGLLIRLLTRGIVGDGLATVYCLVAGTLISALQPFAINALRFHS